MPLKAKLRSEEIQAPPMPEIQYSYNEQVHQYSEISQNLLLMPTLGSKKPQAPPMPEP